MFVFKCFEVDTQTEADAVEYQFAFEADSDLAAEAHARHLYDNGNEPESMYQYSPVIAVICPNGRRSQYEVAVEAEPVFTACKMSDQDASGPKAPEEQP